MPSLSVWEMTKKYRAQDKAAQNKNQTGVDSIPPLLTISEAAKIMRCTTRSVSNYMKKGVLKASRCSKRKVFVLGKSGVIAKVVKKKRIIFWP